MGLGCIIVVTGTPTQQIEPAQEFIVGFNVGKVLARQSLPLAGCQFDLQCGDHSCGDFILHEKDVGQSAIVAFGPAVTALARIGQPHVDAQPLSRPLHTAPDDVTHAKFRPDLVIGFRAVPVSHDRTARHHAQARELRQIGDQIFRNPIGKVILFGITGEVIERQYGDRMTLRMLCQRLHRVACKPLRRKPSHHQQYRQCHCNGLLPRSRRRSPGRNGHLIGRSRKLWRNGSGRRRTGRVFDWRDRRDEAIAGLGNGFYVCRIARVIAQRLA